MLVLAALLLYAILVTPTCVWVYRGGMTLNDHAVVAVVIGCMGVYPVLWAGALAVGISGVALGLFGAALLVGALAIAGLFWVLDQREDPGGRWWWRWIGMASQPAFAFALWTGLIGVFWFPGVLVAQALDRAPGLSPLWPGPLLWIPLALTAWGTAWTFGRHGAVKRHKIVAPGLATPFRLVHLSDIHVSPVMGRADMARLVADTNALSPDLVVVTGDLVMPFSEDRHEWLLEGLAAIRAPVAACPGNHDLPIAQRLARELAEIGVHWLVDAQRVLTVGEGATLEIAGLDFQWRDGAGQVERAMALLPAPPEVGWRLLLAHDPRLFRFLPTDRFDLVLSGHTHGGQVAGDMFGLRASVLRLLGAYDQGFFRRGATRLYVHRGNWHTGLPPRMGVAAEIVLFEVGPGT